MTDITNNIKITNVTPELAEQWLAKNTHNRNLRKPVVNAYASDMANGDWSWNGEAVKFAKDGTLVDGQHRLSAIVQSGVTVKMLVIRGVEKESQHTMDTGAKRTSGDMLKLRGEKNYNPLAAGIRACILWEQGARSFTGRSGGTQTTNTQILRYLENNPVMREYASKFQSLKLHVPMPASIGFLAHKLFYGIDYDDAEHFFNRLASDEGHYKGDPIYALRKILLSPKEAGKLQYTPTYKLAVMIKAWNKFRAGEEVKLLTYRPGGANPEKFPEPI